MLKREHKFINKNGEIIELLCEMDDSQDLIVVKAIDLPTGRKAKPQIDDDKARVFIVYQAAKWYMLY